MFSLRFWSLAVLSALGAALLIGLPTVLISTPFFHRVTPTSPLDYLIWGVSVILIGPIVALAILFPTPRDTSAIPRSGGIRTLLGGILTFLSVGCPVCNQLVVLLLGVGGGDDVL